MSDGEPAREGHGWRVLIVEDEALVALTLEDALSAAGHDVLCPVDRAAPAVRLARQTKIDLAIIDVRLADGDDGIALAEDLVAIQPSLLILYATGNPGLVRERARCGVGCFSKPFEVEWLLRAVDELRAGGMPRSPGFFELQGA